MKKIYLSITIVLLLVASLASVSYAWFTYVEVKSLATFESGELSIALKANDRSFDYDLNLDDLAFMDYENDISNDQYGVFNDMVTHITVDIVTDTDAPLSRHLVSLTKETADLGLNYLLIYEGINIDPSLYITDYYQVLQDIFLGHPVKAQQMAALDQYNQNVLDTLYHTVTSSGDRLTFQIVLWGDYDALVSPETYLDMSYLLGLTIDSINDKGVS